MKVVVKNITRKSRGGISVRESRAESESIMAGRGNDCQIHLLDPRVLLHHAEFSLRSGEIYVDPAPGADMRVNGAISQMTKIVPGDNVRLGPYELILEASPAEGTMSISVELVQPLGDELENLVGRSKTQINAIGFSIRTWSWTLALVALLATFVIPWAASLFLEPEPLRMILNTRERGSPAAPTQVWNTGGISSAHKFFGDSCESCHQNAFVQVKDGTCLACHEGIQHHADPVKFKFASFEDDSCQSCHKEHQGDRTIALSNQAFCVDCHENLTDRTKDTTLRVVSDFGADHPEFRPTVVINSATNQMAREKMISENPQEKSSLHFPHDKHLRTTGVKHPTKGNIELTCTTCHQVDAGGAYMLPLSFERHCHECHQLKFDTFVPDRQMVHEQPSEMFKQIGDVYSAIALRGGYEEPEAPPLVRRRPGTQLTTEEKKIVLDWAAAKTSSIINGRFGRGLCESCHVVAQPANATPEVPWDVEPVVSSYRWYPKARFSHGSHRDVECGTCHQARTSTVASDVIMPTVKNCQACHGGEVATDRVPSTCTFCHDFHYEHLGPMRDAKTLQEAHGAAAGWIGKIMTVFGDRK